MREFVYLRSVRKPKRVQGMIYYTCLNYDRQPQRMRRRIEELCRQAAGEYAGALFAFMTTEQSWAQICSRYAISSSTLERCRRRFYELW